MPRASAFAVQCRAISTSRLIRLPATEITGREVAVSSRNLCEKDERETLRSCLSSWNSERRIRGTLQQPTRKREREPWPRNFDEGVLTGSALTGIGSRFGGRRCRRHYQC